jgi:uncharacterized protein DUF732
MSLKSLALAPVACAVAVAALAAAPIASADAASSFLDELGTLNISLPGKTPAQTVAAGYDSCARLKTNPSVLDEMAGVEQRYGLPTGQGTLFVSAATTNLCPNFAG